MKAIQKVSTPTTSQPWYGKQLGPCSALALLISEQVMQEAINPGEAKCRVSNCQNPHVREWVTLIWAALGEVFF